MKAMILASVAAALLLTACSSKTPTQAQYSGFLSDYQRLKPAVSASGKQTLRWSEPGLTLSHYSGVYLEPIRFYPAAKPNQRVSQETLNQVQAYANTRITDAFKQRGMLKTSPEGKNILVARMAITAVSAENQDLQFYEVIPVAAVLASTMAASGNRTQNTTLFIEAQFIDQDSGRVVMEVVRKGYGKSVSNASVPIKLTDIQSAIDDMVTDIVNFPTKS